MNKFLKIIFHLIGLLVSADILNHGFACLLIHEGWK